MADKLEAAAREKHRSHWYRRVFGQCPPCGLDQSYRERVYGEKPSDPAKRVVWMSDQEAYCGCEYG